MSEKSESLIVQVDALGLVYEEAAKKKDYLLCDLVRIEIQRVLSGKKLLIPTENSSSPTSTSGVLLS